MDSLVLFAPMEVDRLLQCARKACPAASPAVDGWSRSDADFTPLLAAFPALALRSGFSLCAYQYKSGSDGSGVVWAVPVGVAPADAGDCLLRYDEHPPFPRPAGAISVPEALTGDGSPWSYLCASLLARELGAFGAEGHGWWWSTHHLLCDDPWTAPAMRPITTRDVWRWHSAPPGDWRPAHSLDCDGQAIVTFHTYSALGRETIYRHEDRYTPGSYASVSAVSPLAEGGPGFIL